MQQSVGLANDIHDAVPGSFCKPVSVNAQGLRKKNTKGGRRLDANIE